MGKKDTGVRRTMWLSSTAAEAMYSIRATRRLTTDVRAVEEALFQYHRALSEGLTPSEFKKAALLLKLVKEAQARGELLSFAERREDGTLAVKETVHLIEL